MPSTMTPSIVELAELCRASYSGAGEVTFDHVTPQSQPSASHISSRSLPAGTCTLGSQSAQSNGKYRWQLRQKWTNTLGFCAACYERPDSTPVLAFRGSDDAWDWLIDDAEIALGQLPPQAILAIGIVRQAGLGSKGYITGHSLGGALAVIAAAHSGLPAVSFNAPGVMDSCIISSPLSNGFKSFLTAARRCIANPRVVNIRIAGDVVSSSLLTGMQVGGRQRTLNAQQCGLDFGCRHDIDTCIRMVRGKSANYSPLSL